MKIIRLLLKNSGKNFFLAAISSFISGIGGASIIAVINYAITNIDDLPPWLVWLFISLCAVLAIFRFISWVLITRLSQGIIYDLRLELTQRILNCPLQHLEVVGAPKLLATLTGDINAIATSLPQIAQANIALNKINSLGLSLTEGVTEPDLLSKDIFNDRWFSLELVDIDRAYPSDREEHKFSLDKINIQFQPGEIIFIVGGNGSGKSTLVKIITGLYTPDSGKILFNNIPVTDDNREWYRQQFSAIFYDFYLFERLIGIETAQQPQIQNYLVLLEIEHKVTIKDGVLSTTNLSQGQRKRLALLTAYLEDRPIYVFDEWASDQDPVFKEVFYKKLLPELKSRGKTVIAVTHDDRYFPMCDRLIKLDYGSVVKVH